MESLQGQHRYDLLSHKGFILYIIVLRYDIQCLEAGVSYLRWDLSQKIMLAQAVMRGLHDSVYGLVINRQSVYIAYRWTERQEFLSCQRWTGSMDAANTTPTMEYEDVTPTKEGR